MLNYFVMLMIFVLLNTQISFHANKSFYFYICIIYRYHNHNHNYSYSTKSASANNCSNFDRK